MRRIPTLLATTAVFLLLFASVALAQESGAGPVETNDKLITEIGLALIFGFPIFLGLMSWLQSSLDKLLISGFLRRPDDLLNGFNQTTCHTA